MEAVGASSEASTTERAKCGTGVSNARRGVPECATVVGG
jgi:hypothetical protein